MSAKLKSMGCVTVPVARIGDGGEPDQLGDRAAPPASQAAPSHDNQSSLRAAVVIDEGTTAMGWDSAAKVATRSYASEPVERCPQGLPTANIDVLPGATDDRRRCLARLLHPSRGTASIEVLLQHLETELGAELCSRPARGDARQRKGEQLVAAMCDQLVEEQHGMVHPAGRLLSGPASHRLATLYATDDERMTQKLAP